MIRKKITARVHPQLIKTGGFEEAPKRFEELFLGDELNDENELTSEETAQAEDESESSETDQE